MWTNNTRYVIIKSREVITLSSVTDYQFKKFQNTTRTFSSEEKFNLGMNYTDSPIEPGQSKMLVNFDISNDGYSLKPRAGIKTDTVAFVAKTANTNAINNFLSSSAATIICAVGDHIFNNQLYRYAVLLDLDTKKTIISTISNNIESNAKDTDKFKVEGMAISDTCLYSDYINYTMRLWGLQKTLLKNTLHSMLVQKPGMERIAFLAELILIKSQSFILQLLMKALKDFILKK